MDAITINQLTKKYGKQRGIEEVSLTVKEGQIFGFIGPNGAGKSTTIRILLNFLYANSGDAKIFGLDCQKESEKIKKFTSFVSSDVRFYEDMKVKDIFQYVLDFNKMPHVKNPLLDDYYDLFEINPTKKIRELSLGNKKKVALVAALLPNPKLLILDEPTNGLDPLMQHRLFQELTKKNQSGTTILLSSHDLTEVQSYCQEAAFIKDGKILLTEEINNHLEQPKIVTIYGTSLATDKFTDLGAKILSQNSDMVKFLCPFDICKKILPLLDEADIQDFTIRSQELEDKFLSLYEKEGASV